MRRARRWLAALMILGFACAQLISVARACMIVRDAAPVAPAMAAGTAAMPADCPLMAHGPTPQVACEAQCMPQAQADKAADVHIALAPPAVLIVRQPLAIRPALARAMRPLARSASPPVALLFGRFLI